MGLNRVLRRAAARRPAVLLVTLPGATEERLAGERELRRRGWPTAGSPAGATLLVVAGEPDGDGPEWLSRIWQGLPRPRAYVTVNAADEAEEALDRARRELAMGVEAVGPAPGGPDGVTHYGTGDERSTDRPQHHHGPRDEHTGHGEHHDHDHRHQGHAEHDPNADSRQDHHDRRGNHGNHKHGGHQEHCDEGGNHGHDGQEAHHGHEPHAAHDAHASHHGGVVAGRPMAERADDRDGLRLDRLHGKLGPALPDWPTGLVLDVAVQGDVIQRADALVVSAPARASAARYPFWSAPWLSVADGATVPVGAVERRRCAAHLDSLGRLLAIAGWASQAVRARTLRDAVLIGAAVTDLDGDVHRFTRRVRSSRTLRGLLTGLGHLSAARAGSSVSQARR